MEYYKLGKDIVAFTTDRTVGRDKTKLLAALGSGGNLLYPHQTHTDKVFRITDDFLTLPEEERKEQLEGIDAIIYQACRSGNDAVASSATADAWVFGISTADCIPVVVYDKEHHAAAAIHAGWKGTVKRIVEKALDLMQTSYGTSPEQCTAAIGPGISQDSFEVGWEVVEAFQAEGFDMERFTVEMPNMHGDGMKPHIALKEINQQQLVSKGLKPENIMVSPIDTFTDERFFSARREQKGDVKCGRILSGFMLL